VHSSFFIGWPVAHIDIHTHSLNLRGHPLVSFAYDATVTYFAGLNALATQSPHTKTNAASPTAYLPAPRPCDYTPPAARRAQTSAAVQALAVVPAEQIWPYAGTSHSRATTLTGYPTCLRTTGWWSVLWVEQYVQSGLTGRRVTEAYKSPLEPCIRHRRCTLY
jgi:hypothetical protein